MLLPVLPIAHFLAGTVARPGLADTIRTASARFDFQHFESLPPDRRISEAQKEVERLFPAGSKVDGFESYFEVSGARCVRAKDDLGPAVGCIYSRPGWAFVTTDWTVVARLDATETAITTVTVNRYLTGL